MKEEGRKERPRQKQAGRKLKVWKEESQQCLAQEKYWLTCPFRQTEKQKALPSQKEGASNVSMKAQCGNGRMPIFWNDWQLQTKLPQANLTAFLIRKWNERRRGKGRKISVMSVIMREGNNNERRRRKKENEMINDEDDKEGWKNEHGIIYNNKEKYALRGRGRKGRRRKEGEEGRKISHV